MARVLIEARMPEERDGEGWKLDRRGAGGKPEGLGEIAREPRRHGGDDRRPAQHEWNGEKTRRGQGYDALQFELGEHIVHRPVSIVAETGQDVRHPQIVRERDGGSEIELLRAEQAK